MYIVNGEYEFNDAVSAALWVMDNSKYISKEAKNYLKKWANDAPLHEPGHFVCIAGNVIRKL